MFDKKPNAKNIQRAENYFHKAMEHLAGERFGLAAKELGSAIQVDVESTLPLLEEALDDHYRDNKMVACLTLGSVLLKHKTDDFRLANLMGNVQRRLGEIKKANELYKKAIGLNKKNDTALYNLAAGMAKVPLFDKHLKGLIDTYIEFESFLIPLSTFPRDPGIINHLTEMLNMKNYFGKVDRLQELILKKTLSQEEPDLEKMDLLIDRIKEKISQTIERSQKKPDVLKLLQDALDQDWKKISHGEKDRFLWDVLNLGLFVFRRSSLKNDKVDAENGPETLNKGLQSAIDCFFRLKAEGYSYRYLDMIVALSHTLAGDDQQAIDELKDLSRSNPNDRYLNINLGLLYRKVGNRLLSLVYLLKGAYRLHELGGVCHLSEIIDKAGEIYQEGDLKKALEMYRVAAMETDSMEILEKIGEIMIALHRYSDAVQPFREIQRVDPDSALAAEKLKEIQDHYVFLADEFFESREFVKAAEHYEMALEISRPPELLLKASKACKLQGDHKQEYALESEYRAAMSAVQEEGEEEIRLKYVKAGVKSMQNNDFQKAISHFNEAFRIRAGKEVFMYLSYLYKKLKHKQALLQLIRQWNAAASQDG
jgi:tetratricopeptide (TPR) repeat protein